MNVFHKPDLPGAPHKPPTPFRLSPAMAALHSLWYQTAALTNLHVNRRRLAIDPHHARGAGSEPSMLRVRLGCADTTLHIAMPRAFVTELFGAFTEPLSDGSLSDADAVLLLEHAFSALLEDAERLLDLPLRFTIDPIPPGASIAELRGVVALDDAGQPHAITITVPEDAAALWLDRLPRSGAVRRITSPLEAGATVPVSLVVDAAQLTLGELRGLSSGDILVGDKPTATSNICTVCIAALPVWQGRRRDNQVELMALPAGSPSAEPHHHQGESDVDPSIDMQPLIDDVAIVLTFELARKDITVRELRQFQEGSVLTFPPTDGYAVRILANGRQVGTGTLLDVGGALGVKVDRLFAS